MASVSTLALYSSGRGMRGGRRTRWTHKLVLGLGLNVLDHRAEVFVFNDFLRPVVARTEITPKQVIWQIRA